VEERNRVGSYTIESRVDRTADEKKVIRSHWWNRKK